MKCKIFSLLVLTCSAIVMGHVQAQGYYETGYFDYLDDETNLGLEGYPQRAPGPDVLHPSSASRPNGFII
jgi:hypothetical protein